MLPLLEIHPRDVRHAVQLYADDADLAAAVGGYLGSALREGGAALVIATTAHTAAFEAALAAEGIDLARAREDGALLTLDADEMLSIFMQNGRPDPEAFDALIGTLVRRVRETGRRPAAYGEMVARLWESGNIAGAVELEELWNTLLERESFSLLCAYPASLIGESTAAAYRDVCALHSEVLAPGGTREAARSFEHAREAPRAARRFVTETLARWGYDAVVDPAAYVVSELANNAVLHARTDFAVTLTARNGSVRIAVEDHSVLAPRKRAPTSALESGRGLLVIEGLADRWGTDADGSRKTIWAELNAQENR